MLASVWYSWLLKEYSESEYEILIKKILLPIDGSNASIKAAKYAIKIAKQEKAQLICIHAIPNPETIYGFSKPAIILESFYEEGKKVGERWFTNVKSLAMREGVEIRTDIILDVTSIAEAILQYAIDANVDVIVMGTSGKTGLKRFLVGSVANGVVLYAHCPVFVIR